MPYITQQDRKHIESVVGFEVTSVVSQLKHSKDLGQVVFHLMWSYLVQLVQQHTTRHEELHKATAQLHYRLWKRTGSPNLQDLCGKISVALALHPGHYNYIISFIIHQYLIQIGVSYTHLNRVVGILERVKSEFQHILDPLQGPCEELEALDDVQGVLVCIQLELYRMLAAPYEDQKIRENGAVSRLDGFNLEAKEILHGQTQVQKATDSISE